MSDDIDDKALIADLTARLLSRAQTILELRARVSPEPSSLEAALRAHPGRMGVLEQLEEMVEMFRASRSAGDIGAQHHDGEWQDCADLAAKLVGMLGGPLKADDPDADPTLHKVVLTLCSSCIEGDGDQCNTPGCALIRNRPPAFSIRDSCDVESIDGVLFDYDTLKRAVSRGGEPQ